MEESLLEAKIEQSRFSKIVDEFRWWREPENKAYFDHYFVNAVKILFGDEPTNYRVISHENKIVHSFFYGIDDLSENRVSPRNRLVNSDFS